MHEAFGKTAAWRFWLGLLQETFGATRGFYDEDSVSPPPKVTRNLVEGSFRNAWAAVKVGAGL